jgi:hypothetical protein
MVCSMGGMFIWSIFGAFFMYSRWWETAGPVCNIRTDRRSPAKNCQTQSHTHTANCTTSFPLYRQSPHLHTTMAGIRCRLAKKSRPKMEADVYHCRHRPDEICFMISNATITHR